MLLAYKGFDKDLSCTSGRNKFQYQLGVWNEEPKAKCVSCGFHCAANPLDCLNYYRDWDQAVYYLVAADGDINEDGVDSKISCTKMKLIRQLNVEEFVTHALHYMSEHPWKKRHSQVRMDTGAAKENYFTIVRGMDPIAKGELGSVLGLVKEDADQEIIEIGLFVIDGEEYLCDTWYDVEGKNRNIE